MGNVGLDAGDLPSGQTRALRAIPGRDSGRNFRGYLLGRDCRDSSASPQNDSSGGGISVPTQAELGWATHLTSGSEKARSGSGLLLLMGKGDCRSLGFSPCGRSARDDNL